MLENRSIQQINDILIAQLEAQTAKIFPILPKSFLRILSKLLSSVFIILYKTSGWIFLQIFVSTASFKPITILGKTITPLIEWGRLVGIGDPEPATAAEITVLVNVNDIGSILYAGTQWISNINNVVYINQENYTLDVATKSINLIAVTPGVIGNLAISDVVSLTSTLGIIENDAAITAIITIAVDSENEVDYRQRVSERFQLQPQGGAYADYRIWGSAVPGVEQIYVYTGDIPTEVLIYVSGDPDLYTDRIPNSALLLAVGNVIDFNPDTGKADRRPIGAIIDPDGDLSYGNVKAITIKTFDIEITQLVVDDISTVNSAIKTALEDYMFEREQYIEGLSLPPKKNTITQANVIGIINDIVRAYSGTFLTAIISISGVISTNYSLLEGELAKLGTLEVNGVPVT